MNPYASPAALDNEKIIDPVFPPVPRRLLVALVATLVGYAGITVLLLSSTPLDRFYGYFYLPVLLMLAILTASVGLSWVHVRPVSVATSVLQCGLAIWLVHTHGLHMPTWFLAILPTAVVVSVTVACFLRDSRTAALRRMEFD